MLDRYTQAAAQMTGINPTFAAFFLRAYDNPSLITARRAWGLARYYAIETGQVGIVPPLKVMVEAMWVARICDPDICPNRGVAQ